MEVQTITMDPDAAREKLRSVRRRLHRQADDEYKVLEAGYAALAQGTPLINLPDAVRHGGIGPDGRPRFAVARADRTKVRFGWNGRFAEFDAHARTSWGTRKGRYSPALHLRFDLGDVPGFPASWEARRELAATALVPMVPPDVREADPGALRERWILWEVENWTPVPPRDPILLRHLGGDLYAVTGAWELTELERAVMAGRRNG